MLDFLTNVTFATILQLLHTYCRAVCLSVTVFVYISVYCVLGFTLTYVNIYQEEQCQMLPQEHAFHQSVQIIWNRVITVMPLLRYIDLI